MSWNGKILGICSPKMNTFKQDYRAVLSKAADADLEDNWDVDRFGLEERNHGKQLQSSKSWIRRLCLFTKRDLGKVTKTGFKFVKPYLSDLDWLYGKLADGQSRQLLVQLAAYRALGHRKIKLQTNTPEFWKAKELALKIPPGDNEIDPHFLDWKLHERSLESFGYPIRMFTSAGACYTTFVHEQYRCVTSDGVIECAEGDMAIDAGGCYGDTALYLAHKTGRKGHVASFEFLPINVSIFKRNMMLNPNLAERIRLYESPVYSESGKRLFFIGNGPGTRVVADESDLKANAVQTLAIDDLVNRGDFPRIDFVKMDIEGAELQALKGCANTIRRFKPKLAITVYHDFKDFWEIPQYLDSLGLGYEFYLRHFTIHSEETVLFAHTRT